MPSDPPQKLCPVTAVDRNSVAPRVSEAKHFCGAPAGRAPQKLSNIFVAHRGGAAPQKDTFLWRTIVGVRHRYFLAVIAVAVFLLLLFSSSYCWQFFAGR